MGVAIRTGKLCVHPLMAHYGMAGMVRASFYFYNTLEEVDVLVASLVRAKKMLSKQPA